MAFALSHGKLWSVHLNDQNGLKYDQDKSFGAANLRCAYNQIRVLELGELRPDRTVCWPGRQGDADPKGGGMPHCISRIAARSSCYWWTKCGTFPREIERQCIADRDYEALELAVLKHLLGS